MFIAGIIGGVVVGGAIAHGNHSDHSNHGNYSDYSEYSDAYLTDKIYEKKEQLEREQEQISELQEEVRCRFEQEIKALSENEDIFPVLDELEDEDSDGLKCLSDNAIKRLEKKLKEEIDEDQRKLQEIDKAIQKINQMRLMKK